MQRLLKVHFGSQSSIAKSGASDELGADLRDWSRRQTTRRSHQHRPFRRPRPRILHRPRLRSRSSPSRSPTRRGEPVVFGSVGGGGRYDGLVGRFRGEDVPATGFSVGVSRLASALKALGKTRRGGRDRPGRRHRHGPRAPRRLPENGRRRCATPASRPRCISAPPA